MARILQWREWEAQWVEIPDDGMVAGKVGCEPTKVIVYGGHGITDGNGVWTTVLPWITCGTPEPAGRPSIVATPTWDFEPTATITPTVLGAEVSARDIRIFSHHLDGSRAKEVPFSWHLIVEMSREP
jgi:hypothetical protein